MLKCRAMRYLKSILMLGKMTTSFVNSGESLWALESRIFLHRARVAYALLKEYVSITQIVIYLVFI